MKGTIIVFLLFLVIPTVYAKNNLGYINNIGNTSTLYINGQVGDISKNIPFDSDTATLIINYDSTTSSISIGNIEISGDSAKIYSQTITDKHLKIYKGRLIYGKLIGSYVGITNKIPVRISAGTINNLQVIRVANYNPDVVKKTSISIVSTFAPTSKINLGTHSGSIFYLFSEQTLISFNITNKTIDKNTRSLNQITYANIFYMYSVLVSKSLSTSETSVQNVNINIENTIKSGLFYLYSHPKYVNLQKFKQSVSYTYLMISNFYGNIFGIYSNPENVSMSVTQLPISTINISLNESITISN